MSICFWERMNDRLAMNKIANLGALGNEFPLFCVCDIRTRVERISIEMGGNNLAENFPAFESD